MTIMVTKESHPLLVEMFKTIDHDSGKSGGLEKLPKEYEIPDKWETTVQRAEQILGELTPAERQTLAIGERTEMLDICRKNTGCEELNLLFGAYFADWADEDLATTYGMTVEEAKRIITDGQPHATVTYDLVSKVMRTHLEYRLSYVADELARLQREQDDIAARMYDIREDAKQVRVANTPGTRDDILIVVDGTRGIYAPQSFCEMFNFEDFDGIAKEDWDIVLAGPNAEPAEGDTENYYWDAWEEISGNANIVLDPATFTFHTDEKGRLIRYYIWQDGDIWLVPVGLDPEDNPDA